MMLRFKELQDKCFDGRAWTVVYEYGLGDEYWGCDGEYADEPDFWFLDQAEAIEFAQQAYPDEYLIEMLYNSPDSGGADSITLMVECWDWVDGLDEFRVDEESSFVRFEKNADGEVVVAERQGI